QVLHDRSWFLGSQACARYRRTPPPPQAGRGVPRREMSRPLVAKRWHARPGTASVPSPRSYPRPVALLDFIAALGAQGAQLAVQVLGTRVYPRIANLAHLFSLQTFAPAERAVYMAI